MEEQHVLEVRRRRRPRWLRNALLVLLFLLLAGLLALWLMRVRLAEDYIDRELAERGVQATYDVKRIGFGTQIFENLVIGDPRRPDLTARVVRVQILFGLTGPRVGLITARGVRMRGRISGGRLSLGQIDRLLPPPSGLPFRLPDQRIDVADSAILLDSPAGRFALGLAGRGNLSDGFRGNLAMVSQGLSIGRCAIARPRANVAVRVDDLRPAFRGPAAIERVRCGNDLAVDRALFALDARLAPALDSWRGSSGVRAAGFRAGPHNMAGIDGRLTFDGNARETRGGVELGSAQAAVDMFRAARTRFAGRYAVSPRHGDLSLLGDVTVRGLVVRGQALARIAGALRSTGGTPVGPIGAQLAEALLRAGRGGGEAAATVRLVNGKDFGAVRFEQLRFDSRSGARLRVSGGRGLTYYWPDGLIRIDGGLALSGGGFPDTRFSLSQPPGGGPLQGVGRIAPISAGGARLALGELRFVAGPDGRTTFRTTAQLDGPFKGGRIVGLTLPVGGRFGRGGFALGEDCVHASFQMLVAEDLRIGPSRFPLCPIGPALVWKAPGGRLQGGAAVRAPRFAGRLGGSPIALASDRLRFDLAGPGFTAANVDVRLGTGTSVNTMQVASLSGRFTGGGVDGAFAGLSTTLAAVPLLVSEGTGSWRVQRGNLLLAGRIRVEDRQEPDRFHPLAGEDFRLTLVNGRIDATGWLTHPATGTRVTRAEIAHNLRTGAGSADLDVPGIRFAEGFQPEALTPLTVGVVALVEGTLSGRGRIEWDGGGTRSSGTFSTADMDFAAPFGPVEGLTTNVIFTDLLGLVSAPGQLAEIDLVRTGVDILDGRIRYQLRPNSHVAVESGRWPFAGGELLLEPTLLDFSRPTTKYLTFRVVGMDAARFVQQMEFSNIAATGTFDGIIPLQLDQSGGRIVDGRLTARPEGGTLSYVGEVTEADLGVYGKLAFDALRSLRYSRFDMRLDGALAGEFLTDIELDGVARDPALTGIAGGGIRGMVARRALAQLSRIPFEFNIRVQGPFRALLGTARSFDDPTLLIQSVLPQMLRDAGAEPQPDVQDEESENEP